MSKIKLSRTAEDKVSDVAVYKDFRYGGLTVVTFVNSLEKWFVASEICEKLGYTKNSKYSALSNFVSDMDKILVKPKNFGAREIQGLKINNSGNLLINLRGLIALATNSTLPNAKQYQDWVLSTITYIENNGHYTDASLADSMDRMNLLFNPSELYENNPIVVNQQDFRVIEIGLPSEIRKRVIDLAFYMTFRLRAYDLAPVSVDVNINYLWIAYQCGGIQGRESVVTNIKFILDKLRLGWPIEELEMRLGEAFSGFTSMYTIPDGPGFRQRREEHRLSEDPGRISNNNREVKDEHGFSYDDYINNSHNYQYYEGPAYSYDDEFHTSSSTENRETDRFSQYMKTEYDREMGEHDMELLFKRIEELNKMKRE